MKTTAKLFSLMATVLMLAACKPENIEVLHERDITYYLLGSSEYSDNSEYSEPTTVHLTTEAEFDALLEQFCNYAEGGSTVTFHNSVPSGSPARKAAKEATTYSTTSREEMKAWMRQMEDQGKTVTVTYDPATGTWNGTAYANAPQPPVSNGVATYVNTGFDGWGNVLNVIVTIDSLNRTAYVNIDNNNHWLHMPCGVFHDIYDENGRLILGVWNDDTLYIDRNYEDSLMICFAYSGFCTADHTHECYLVPSPQGLQTWYCSSPYDIILNRSPYVIDTYPGIHIAQICATAAENINCIPAFWTGNCEMIRYFTDRTDVDWELSLRYIYNNDSSYYMVDSLGISGYPDDSQAALPMVIHDLHQYPGCASQYVFQRIN